MSIHAPVEATPRVVDTRPPVLITEHEVKLLTAAPITPGPKPGILSRWLAAHRAAHHVRTDHRRLVAHYEFLENAAMARAMEHL